jgi:hypothetical protein
VTADVSALFVRADGPYPSLVVDWWDEARDARLYAGPRRVVTHPPCERWCRIARVVEARYGYRVGDDGGCFESALASVRRWGGVLEHPAWSLAWPRYGLPTPPPRGWQRELFGPGWLTEVSQAAYGHRAQKLTWLYYVGPDPPSLDWSRPEATALVSFLSNGGGRTHLPRLRKREAETSPIGFAKMLVELASLAQLLAQPPTESRSNQ